MSLYYPGNCYYTLSLDYSKGNLLLILVLFHEGIKDRRALPRGHEDGVSSLVGAYLLKLVDL